LSLYIKQIEQLILLQQVDDEIIQLQKVLDDAPKKVSAIEERLEVQKNQQNELLDKINMLQQQQARRMH